MDKIACSSELCELNEHEAGWPRHLRITSGPDAPYRVSAHWGTAEGGHVLLTHEDATLTLTARDAALLARIIGAGGMWSPTFGGGSSVAVDLGAAAEVLSCVDPAGEVFDFGHGHLDRSVRGVVAEFFEGAHV